MQWKIIIAAIGLNMVLGSATSAARHPIKCPESISPSSVKVIRIPAEWTPFVASPLYLHSAAPMDGPPEMRGDLAEYTEHKSKRAWSYTYGLEGHFPHGKWIQCGYGEFNQITLSQKLPDEVLACTFIYRKGAKAGQHDIDILCH